MNTDKTSFDFYSAFYRATSLIAHILHYCFYLPLFPKKQLGMGVAIDRFVRITYPRNITLGSYVHLQESVWLNSIGESRDPKVIQIGERSDIGRYSFISARQSIVIEKSVLLAPNVFISDHSHEYHNTRSPILDGGTTKPQPVRIGEGSWIGINAVILPGTQIGKHCIVGANSVVKGSFPDYSLIAGTPARRIRSIAGTKKRSATA